MCLRHRVLYYIHGLMSFVVMNILPTKALYFEQQTRNLKVYTNINIFVFEVPVTMIIFRPFCICSTAGLAYTYIIYL